MKLPVIIVLALLSWGCCAKKVVQTAEKLSGCPADGKCSVTVLHNKSLEVKADEFGSLYYQVRDNPATSVVVYKYERNVPQDLADAGYREEVIFEISNADQQLALSGKQLQQVKMLFGRFCFCRGQTGNYKVQTGNLNLNRQGGAIQFDLDFTITEVPQIIHSVQATVK